MFFISVLVWEPFSHLDALTVCLTTLLPTADPMSESKEDQWMGVTVQSQGPGGKVVVSIEKHALLSVGWSWTDSTGHNTELPPQFTFEQQTPWPNVGPDAETSQNFTSPMMPARL